MREGNKFETMILDIDGGVVQQKKLISRYDANIIPLFEKTGELRFWCHKNEMEELRNHVVESCKNSKPKAIFCGSGDYHHLAYIGISMIKEPVTVIHFDNHSDYWREEFVNFMSLGKWRRGYEYFNYGSWVIPCLRLPNVKKFLQFGVDGDFQFDKYLYCLKGMKTHAFDLLLQKRIETYTYKMKESLLGGRISGSFNSVHFKPGVLTTKAIWKNMQEHGGIQKTIEKVIPQISTDAVYITIDKDVLDDSESFSAYPGFTGTMKRDDLMSALSFIQKEKRVVGLDVCGDASSYEAITSIPSFTKWFMARRQYSKIPKEEFSSPENINLNESVNLEIMEMLCK